MERKIVTAEPGYLLTNGKTTGHTVFLADGEDPADYSQIPEEDFFSAIEDPASAEDYQAALREMGVSL